MASNKQKETETRALDVESTLKNLFDKEVVYYAKELILEKQNKKAQTLYEKEGNDVEDLDKHFKNPRFKF